MSAHRVVARLLQSPATVAEIAADVGMPETDAHAALVELWARGWVVPDGERWRVISPGVAHLLNAESMAAAVKAAVETKRAMSAWVSSC